MRKLILTAVASAILSLTMAHAQIYIGPKVGGSLNRFSLRGDDVTDLYSAKTRAGFTAGIVIDIPLTSGLSIQPEVLYSQFTYFMEDPRSYNFYLGDYSPIGGGLYAIGTQTDYPENIADSRSFELFWDESYSISSLEVPVLIKYEFIGSSFGYFFEVGPSFSIGLNGRANDIIRDREGNESADDFLSNIIDGEPDVSKNYERWIESHNRNAGSAENRDFLRQQGFLLTQGDFDDEFEFRNNGSSPFKTLNIGIAIGGGIYIETGLGRAYLGVRYIRGLSNFWNDRYSPFQFSFSNQRRLDYEAFDTRTNNLQLSVSYAFPLGGGF